MKPVDPDMFSTLLHLILLSKINLCFYVFQKYNRYAYNGSQKSFLDQTFMFDVQNPMGANFEIDKQEKWNSDKTNLKNLFDIYMCQQEL